MALEKARKTVAENIGARSSSEITFTSGATESNNLAIKGAARALASRGRHLMTQSTEHPAVLDVFKGLQAEGFDLTILKVGHNGLINPMALVQAIRPDTTLISLMLANNETGVIQPVAEIAEAAHKHGIIVHCDAAQGPAKVIVNVQDLGVDLLSLSGHKCYGPKGSGALFVRRMTPALKLKPLFEGGGHEQGLRSGTANLPAAVGLAAALQLASDQLQQTATSIANLRDDFERTLVDRIPNVVINGSGSPRLPNTSNVAFPGVDGEALMASLPGLAVSSGSACASVHPEPSKVLRAMGLPKALANSALRVSLGRTTTEEEVQRAAQRIVEEVRRLQR